MQKTIYSLSIIMPSLNEQANIMNAISDSFEATDLFGVEAEIIVINDGSTDDTKLLVEKYISRNRKRKIKLINHNKPMGIGYSFMEGVKNSTNDIVVMFPGDNENDQRSAIEFFKLMDNVDIIVPFIHNDEMRNRFRRLLSSLYRFIINMSFGISLNYTNGTVFYRRCVFDDILLDTTGFFYQAELLIKLIRKGYLFAEVPNILSVRLTGKTKAVSLKSFLNIVISYIHLIINVHILRESGHVNIKTLNKNSISFKKYNNKI